MQTFFRENFVSPILLLLVGHASFMANIHNQENAFSCCCLNTWFTRSHMHSVGKPVHIHIHSNTWTPMSMFIDAKQDFPADCREKWQRQVIPL